MLRATELAHLLLRPSLRPGDWAVDATTGNGHDTLFLAQCVGSSGRVYGFDVQATALDSTAERIGRNAQVTLIRDGHENMSQHLPAPMHGKLAAIMFNLGYLPGTDKKVITRAQTTLAALKQAVGLIRLGGVVSALVYPGHPGGAEEADAAQYFAETLPPAFGASYHSRLTGPAASPRLILIERLR